MKIITDERCVNYSSPGHPERPARISRTMEKLRAQKELPIVWEKPLEAGDAVLLRAHSPEHIARVKTAAGDFDGDTPAYSQIFEHASRSVGGALQALRSAQNGEPSFCLLRPPGHHATRDQAMGFCYLNSVAVAALTAREAGVARVAILDFDVHHGNGTEAILLDQPGCAFFSIHQFPAYPGTGKERVRNCFNYPLAPQSPRPVYREMAVRAFEDLKRFRPDLVAVSAGFDAYARDPLCQQQLEAEDFHWFGLTLRALNVPFFSILEGGYSGDLPELILAYLKGVAGL